MKKIRKFALNTNNYNAMKTESLIFGLLAAMFLALAGCKKEPVPVSDIMLRARLSLEPTEKQSLKATISPVNADNKSVSWTSSNPSVATVDPKTGEVTAVAVGQATVTATSVDGGKTAHCEVTVLPSDVLTMIIDPMFRAYCKSQGWDRNGDGKLSPAEAADVRTIDVGWGHIGDIESEKITSLAGIDYFTGLVTLDCGSNLLTTLDISKNTSLAYLYCSANKLTSLDMSNNPALTVLSCNTNALTTLDISKNTLLTLLDCSYNELTALDASKNIALGDLNCSQNRITALDVSGCAAMKTLLCDRNDLTALDVSGCIALDYLGCFENRIASLDLSKCTALTAINCGINQLTTLDVSNNTALTELDCNGNQITVLDMSKNLALSGLGCSFNLLTELDVSKNSGLSRLWCHDNPGEGNVFPVAAWFDNDSIPNTVWFSTGWQYDGKTVTVDYRKVT